MRKKISATVLFVDIMNSTEIANYLDTKQYNDFLNEFQHAMLSGIALWNERIKEVRLEGDELAVFFYSGDIVKDIVCAINLANTLKILWCIGVTNRRRVRGGKQILDLGIGINTGEVIKQYRPTIAELRKLIPTRKTVEGLAISVAKRIEGFSRQGRYSKIMIGHRTMAELNELYHHHEYVAMGLQKFKGISQEIPVFELKSGYSYDAEILAKNKSLNWAIKQLERVKVFDPGNIWLLMTLIDIYGNKKNYKKVERLCREAIAVDSSVANIHCELGSALAEQKKHEEALIHFTKAIELKWDSWEAYVGKSASLIFVGSYDECISTCQWGIKNLPVLLRKRFGDALYFNMAAAHARKGESGKALRTIRRAVEVGGAKMIKSLKKDEDKDFYNLYENVEFRELLRGRSRGRSRKAKK